MIVHGRSIPSLQDADLFELRKKFGVLFQDGALFGSMNLYDNVAFPLRQHTEKGEDEIADIVNRRLREVGLGNANEKMPNELSGGMRKRAGFARALVLEPEIVLFDEPDSGLDPVRTALLCELIKEVHAENGGCYVVITHDIMSARRVAEHISVLWKGRIVESGPAPGAVRIGKPVRAPVPLRRIGRAPRNGVSARRMPGRRSRAASRTAAAARARAGGGDRARGRPSSPLRLQPTAATSTFVSSSSAEYRATQSYYRSFGEEPIEVLVKGNLQQLVLSSDLDRLLGLEGCLSGNVPAAALAAEGGPRGPCGKLARAHTVKVVFGPGTFINEAAELIDQQLAGADQAPRSAGRPGRRRVVAGAALARGLAHAEARRRSDSGRARSTIARFQEELVTLALQYGLTARPSIDEPELRLDRWCSTRPSPPARPKQRFAYLFPSADSALISVRMKAGLSEAQRTRTIALIRGAVAMPQWQLQHGGAYLRHRRAGDRRRPDRIDHARDRAAAGRGR